MATETLKEVRKMAPDQLAKHEEELRDELFKLKTRSATEKVKDLSQFKKLKKDIARVLTIRREAEIKAKTK
jgi:large subunit ribosomal protein L29